MTVARQSTRDEHAVCAKLQGLQHRQFIHTPRAGQLDDFQRWRVLDAQPSSQVSGGIGAVLAAVGDDLVVVLIDRQRSHSGK
jgi:hypothetical protein